MARSFTARRDEDGRYYLEGELSIHVLDQFKKFLVSALESGDKSLFVSLKNISFIDTACLQMLLVFKKSLEPGGVLRVTEVSDEVEKILSLSGLKAALL